MKGLWVSDAVPPVAKPLRDKDVLDDGMTEGGVLVKGSFLEDI